MRNGTKEVIDVLLADDAVASMVGDRVYPVVERDGAPMPLIVVSCEGMETRQGKCCVLGRTQLVNVYVAGKSYKEMTEVASAVVDAMDRHQREGKTVGNYSEEYIENDVFSGQVSVRVEVD